MTGVADPVLDRARLSRRLEGERARFGEVHPRSAEAYAAGRGSLFGGVPMT